MARERDEAAVQRWVRHRWPGICRQARQCRAHLVFLDESGLLLLPTIRRTQAPRGQTPVLRHRARRRDKVSAAAALCLSGGANRIRLFTALYPNAYVTGEKTAVFLQAILRRLRGPIFLLWDQGSMHKGPFIQALLENHPRLKTFWLPAYAPELNPPEALWNHLKADRMANFAPRDIPELLARLLRHLRRVQRNQSRLRSFFRASPLFAGRM